MITPTNGHYLVKVDKVDKEQRLKSGIILVNEQNLVAEKGIVIAVADDVGAVGVKIGSTVFYKDYDLSTVKVDEEEYNFLKHENILGYE